MMGIVANVAEVGGQGGVAVCSRGGGLKGSPFTWGTWAVVVVSTGVVTIAPLLVALVAGRIAGLLHHIALRVVDRITWVARVLTTLVMLGPSCGARVA